MAKVTGTQWNFQEKNQRVSRVNSEFLRNSISQHMCQDGSVNLPSQEVDAIIRNLSRKEKKISKLWWALGFAAIFSVALFALTFASALAANEKSKESHVNDGSIQDLDGHTVGVNEVVSFVPLSKLVDMPMVYIEKLDKVTYILDGNMRVDAIDSAEFADSRLSLYVRGGQERIVIMCGVVRHYSKNGGAMVEDVVDGEWHNERQLASIGDAAMWEKGKAYALSELQNIHAEITGRDLESQGLYEMYEFFGGVTTSSISPDVVEGEPLWSAAGEEDHCTPTQVINRPELSPDEANALFQSAAVTFCADADYDGNSTCNICDEVTSGALKFTDMKQWPCVNGEGYAEGSMASMVSKLYLQGTRHFMEGQCEGEPVDDSVVDTLTCPWGSYAVFAFAVIEEAWTMNVDGGLHGPRSIDELCDAAAGYADGSLTDMICNERSYRTLDDSTQFEYMCENDSQERYASFAELWSAGHSSIESFVAQQCGGGDELRRLSAGGKVFKEEITEFPMVRGAERRMAAARKLFPAQLKNCCGNKKYGNCGPDDTCWSWVCGSCDNAYRGCYEHDWFCSCSPSSSKVRQVTGASRWGLNQYSWFRCAEFAGVRCGWPGCAKFASYACDVVNHWQCSTKHHYRGA